MLATRLNVWKSIEKKNFFISSFNTSTKICIQMQTFSSGRLEVIRIEVKGKYNELKL
jgi:hypothetical protein